MPNCYLELLKLTLRDTTKLKQKTSGGGRLARVDMAANNDGQMLLAFRHVCFLFVSGTSFCVSTGWAAPPRDGTSVPKVKKM